jgi:peptide/nickel transport system substrate-binding protein
MVELGNLETFMVLSRRSLLASSAALALAPRLAHAQAPRRGGVLRVAADSEYRNWNPAIAANNGVFLVARKVIEPLFDLGADGKTLVPVLATGWTPSQDGKTHSFTLRGGVKWHDGRDFGSGDVAFSALELWRKLQNFGRDVFRNLEAVDTPDATTAVFRFAQPIPAQLLAAALAPLANVVPRHVYEGTDLQNNPANISLVGTGPFRFGEYRRGEFFRLARNPAYWGEGQPLLDGIVYRVMPDKGAVAAALEAGELELATFGGVSIEDMQRLGKLPSLEVVAHGYEALPYLSILEFNFARPELQNPKVRQAIAHALNPQAAVDTIFLGLAKPAVGPIPTTDPVFHTSQLPGYPFDPRRAEALLDEAGYRKGADGMRFALKIVPAPFFEQTRRIGDMMRQSLRQVGIDASIQNTDLAGYFAAVYRERNFDLTSGVYAYRQDPAISTTVLYGSGTPAGVPFSNQRGYASPEMDGLLREAAAQLDADKRIALYRRFQELAMTDLPLIPFVEFPLVSVASRRLRGHHDNPRWAVTSWGSTWLAA